MAIVSIKTGKLEGTERDGRHAFKGIPFAATTAGVNRWRPPQPGIVLGRRALRDGTPAANGLREWMPYDAVERNTMNFDSECRLEKDVDGNLRRLWEAS